MFGAAIIDSYCQSCQIRENHWRAVTVIVVFAGFASCIASAQLLRNRHFTHSTRVPQEDQKRVAVPSLEKVHADKQRARAFTLSRVRPGRTAAASGVHHVDTALRIALFLLSKSLPGLLALT